MVKRENIRKKQQLLQFGNKQNIKRNEFEKTKTKGEEEQNPYRQMKIRCYQQKKDYIIYEMFSENLMVITKNKSRPTT